MADHEEEKSENYELEFIGIQLRVGLKVFKKGKLADDKKIAALKKIAANIVAVGAVGEVQPGPNDPCANCSVECQKCVKSGKDPHECELAFQKCFEKYCE